MIVVDEDKDVEIPPEVIEEPQPEYIMYDMSSSSSRRTGYSNRHYKAPRPRPNLHAMALGDDLATRHVL